MRLTLFVHILAGALGLLFGYVALYSSKGAAVHRKSGTLFVYAMLTMSACGLTIAVVRNVGAAINVPAALLAAYLVTTGLTAVRPLARGGQWLDRGAMLVALGVALSCLTFTLQAFANGGKRDGMPAFPFILFGTIAMLGSIGDLRMMRSGALQGAKRVARHLWRMSFALFIAAMSFFIGQAKVIPKPFRITPLLALPVLAVLLTMFYWMWRVRRRSYRAAVVAVHEAV